MALDRTTALRGALAGAAAAGVWAAQQPFDKRVFGVDYDDVDLLGRLVTGRSSYGVGLALHLANGAVFGALYAAAAPALPVAAPLRGPLAALAEHLATWPATAALARARPDLAPLWPSRRAFAQATWRHLLFGAVLGALERRLNEPEARPVDPEAVASNGHGSAEHLVPIGP